MEMRYSPKSLISGSRATLLIVVVPFAKTAAVIRFSVAPTLGKTKSIVAPCNLPLLFAMMNPCSKVTDAPSASKPLI